MKDQKQSKKNILKDKVVLVVQDFVKTEGGITIMDIESLFGYNGHQEIATALYTSLSLTFSEECP